MLFKRYKHRFWLGSKDSLINLRFVLIRWRCSSIECFLSILRLSGISNITKGSTGQPNTVGIRMFPVDVKLSPGHFPADVASSTFFPHFFGLSSQMIKPSQQRFHYSKEMGTGTKAYRFVACDEDWKQDWFATEIFTVNENLCFMFA